MAHFMTYPHDKNTDPERCQFLVESSHPTRDWWHMNLDIPETWDIDQPNGQKEPLKIHLLYPSWGVQFHLWMAYGSP